jgi:catechol 2,3-dioxygenase-like lactoylglutathione lyase family enzyme
VQPVLMSSDVAASIAFYESLGFRESFRDRPDRPAYAGVSRDGVTLHLQWNAEALRAGEHDRPTYRFVCAEVDELFESLARGGAITEAMLVVSPLSRPLNTSWGTREFHLLDPDGNGLQFYESVTS